MLEKVQQIVKENALGFTLSGGAVVVAIILLVCGKAFDLSMATLLGALALFAGLFAPFVIVAMRWEAKDSDYSPPVAPLLYPPPQTTPVASVK